MKLIPKKKQLSAMQIVKQALENESLAPTAKDILVKGKDWIRHLKF